jgi:ribonuclease VapC
VILDTSALIAILRDEPEAAAFAEAIDGALIRRISAATWLETAIVIDANGDPVLSRRFDDLVRQAALRIEPVTEAQARIARDAYRDFGKGTGHGSTSATASPTRWRKRRMSRCCSRAGTSRRRM